MDFHSLSRKELQTLCKKNKIPANITNVAMADALSALPQVEGLDEFLNPNDAEGEAGAGTPDTHHRTACRTSTRRKEPQSSKVVSSQRPQRRTGGGNGEEGGVAEQENKDANVIPVTPAARRRATAVSTRRSKKEPELAKDDEEKKVDHGKPTDVTETPAAVPRSSRARAIGRSVCPKTEGTSVQNGYNTRRSVRLLEKNLSKMSLIDGEDTGLGEKDDVSEAISSVSQQIEDSADTEEVCDAGVSLLTVSNVVLEEADELEVSSLEKKSECECQEHDSGSEVKLVSRAENDDVGAGLEPEPEEADSNMKADSETREDSNEIPECSDDVSDVDMNKPMEVEAAQADSKTGSDMLSDLEDSGVASEAENKQEAVSVEASQDAPIELGEQDDTTSLPMSPVSDVDEVDEKINEAEPLNVADVNFIQHFEPMKEVDEIAEDEPEDLESSEGVLELQDEEPENLEESLAEVEKVDSTSSAIASAKDDADTNTEDSIDVIELCVESSANNGENIALQSPLLDDHPEELEAKSENTAETLEEVEKIIDSVSDVTVALEKDASYENSIAVGVCTDNVTLESSLVDVAVQEAEEQKDDSSQYLEAKAQREESNEQAAAEEVAISNLDPCLPSETVTVAPIHELKTTSGDTPIQPSETKGVANMKENLTKEKLNSKSMGELRKMLKKLSIKDDKSNYCKSKTAADNNVVKEVERKRTALQALPENQMTKGASQISDA